MKLYFDVPDKKLVTSIEISRNWDCFRVQLALSKLFKSEVVLIDKDTYKAYGKKYE